MKKITTLFLLVALTLALVFAFAVGSGAINNLAAAPSAVASAADVSTVNETASVTASEAAQTQDSDVQAITVDYKSDDLNFASGNEVLSAILLQGDSITVEGDGVTVSGTIATITSAGVYEISGALNNGQIVVDTEDEETVTLVLNGVDITYATSAPIFVSNAEKTVITLAEGTENVVTDGAAYIFPDPAEDEPNAAIFSKDDLTINGNGALTVNANYNNGIASKDDLKITAGNIIVNATNDGIKGRDSIAILDGVITVNAGGDGLQSNNDEDAEKGIVAIEGGVLNIVAGADGVQAETVLTVSGGDINIVSGGGSENTATDSAKGLKGGVHVAVSGGTITVDAADDAIHANGSITIDGGDFQLATSDDGVHADASLVVNGGNLTVSRSYEGLESGIIVINDGVVRVVTSDDGINVAGGTGGSYLEINGGYIMVDSIGDSLDANGPGTMNGGVLILNAPVNPGGGNGVLDLDGSLTINGGLLVAAGSYGMGVSLSTASTQYTVLETLSATQAAGTIVHVESADGTEIVTFAPSNDYQNIIISSPDLEYGESYRVYTSGSATGTMIDGLYVDGTYTPGGEVSSFTVTGAITGENTSMGGRPGRP